MAKTPVDVADGPAFILKGRVVTMNGAFDVLANARLCIDQGVIVHVLASGQPVPPAFAAAPVVDTRGTIYPGLIELHNHLSYNAIPPWVVPRKFENRAHWPRHPDYRRLITGPASILGRTRGLIEAMTRYVEAKCLVAGVTTSQGISLASNAGTQRFYRGVVRNVEHTADPGLPLAKTHIPDVAARDAEKFFGQLGRAKTLLLHLSEGLDQKARDHFSALEIGANRWAITPALVGIHCAGLQGDDFKVLHAHGGAMVWSPLSNLLLYGGTADIRRAIEAGVPIALGSDWSPSGSKNLLAELKVARILGDALGGVLTTRDLVAMVTSTPARILKWHDRLGSIATGKLADLMVIGKASGDAYDALLAARESDVELVVINGWPRYGTPALMAPFPTSESRTVAGVARRFNLAHAAADPLVRDLTLGDAEARLTDAMLRLPELALQLEDPIASGSLLGAREPDGDGTLWFVDFDHEDHGGQTARPQLPRAGGLTGFFGPVNASEPLSQILEPMRLDPLTIADDDRWADTLVAQINLDPAIKRELARAYGQTLPAPPAAPGGGVAAGAAGEASGRTIRTLRELLDLPGRLTLDDQCAIVRQALTWIEGAYVHLPLKRAMHAVDPVQRLRLFGDRLTQAPSTTTQSEWEFHRELIAIFASLRDLHTSYLLPAPFRYFTAYLPFLVEAYADEEGVTRYLVSKVVGSLPHPTFQPGVEVLYWNGSPIGRVVAANAAREAGSNPDARLARGLAALTVRPLVKSMPPDEEWVTITYRDLAGTRHEFRRRWLVRDVREAMPEVDASDREAVARATALGMDLETDLVNDTRKALYATAGTPTSRTAVRSARSTARPWFEPVDSRMPWVFRAARLRVRRGEFAYARIFTFNVPSADAFVEEFCRLLTLLPGRGLVLDVRGNGGGLIYAAEQLLQVLTPRRIEPQPAELATTPFMLRLSRRHAPSTLLPGFDLGPWITSMAQALQTGATYSVGHSITPVDAANAVGQRYTGPVVLITDGLCYSATDMFAAGFQDHEIGPVLGVGGRTGAGGANVWTSQLLAALASDASIARLPHGAGFTVAVRRTMRVGAQSGTPVEDLGIEPDERCMMTRRDLLEGNRDLLDKAVGLIAGRPSYLFEFAVTPIAAPARAARAAKAGAGRPPLSPDRKVRVTMCTSNIDRVDVLGDGRPMLSHLLKPTRTTTTKTVSIPRATRAIEALGFRRGAIVVARRWQLRK